jgi:hypothetical protein
VLIVRKLLHSEQRTEFLDRVDQPLLVRAPADSPDGIGVTPSGSEERSLRRRRCTSEPRVAQRTVGRLGPTKMLDKKPDIDLRIDRK